jgi:hypothetical protein
LSFTSVIDFIEPRSTVIHCGSLDADDQRVPVLPSTAFAASYPAPWIDDAVAVPFSTSSERTAVSATGSPSMTPGPHAAASKHAPVMETMR